VRAGFAAGGWRRAGVAAYGSRRACKVGGRFVCRDSPRALREGIHGGRAGNCLAGAVYRIVLIVKIQIRGANGALG
jgi:hypothetical protein